MFRALLTSFMTTFLLLGAALGLAIAGLVWLIVIAWHHLSILWV